MTTTRWAVVSTVAALGIIAAAMWSHHILLDFDDYGQFLLHAQALVDGRPYGDTGYIHTAFRPFTGPPLASPGLPLTLVPLLALGIATPMVLKVMMLLALAAFMVLAGRSLWSVEPIAATAAVLVSGSALLLMNAQAAPATDLVFAALLWATVLLADRPGDWTFRRAFLLSFVGAWALLYRLAAVAILPALALYWVVNRRKTGWWPLLPLAVLAVVFGWQYFVVGIGQFESLPPGFEIADYNPGRLEQFTHNLATYRIALFESHLYPTPSPTVNRAYHLLSAAIAAFGLAIWAWRTRRSFAPIMALSYCGLLLWIGVVATRYMWPLYPLGAFGFFFGLQTILRSRLKSRVKPDLAVFVVAMAMTFLAFLSRGALIGDVRPTIADPRVNGLLQEVRELHHADASIRMGYFKPRSMTWLTGVPAMPLFEAPEEATLGELEAKRITHVVVGGLGLYQGLFDHWNRFIADNPDVFDRVWANDGFVIYRVRPTKTGA